MEMATGYDAFVDQVKSGDFLEDLDGEARLEQFLRSADATLKAYVTYRCPGVVLPDCSDSFHRKEMLKFVLKDAPRAQFPGPNQGLFAYLQFLGEALQAKQTGAPRKKNLVQRRARGSPKRRLLERSVALVVEALNFCPEDSRELYVTYSDVVRVAQASARVAASINWRKVARFAVNDLLPQRKRRTLPAIFPLHVPRLPTRMSSSAVATLCRKAALDDGETRGFRAVATAYAVRCWGSGGGSDAPIDSLFVAVACGVLHTVGLRNNGTVVTWGSNSKGQRNDTPTCSGFVAIACGWNHSIGLRNNGTVVTWGSTSKGQRDDAPTGTGFVALACRGDHNVGLRNDGRVVAWGAKSDGQRNNTPKDGGFVAISCGRCHSAALHNDGTIVTWGNKSYSQRCDAPTSNDFVAIACGGVHSVGLRHDGTVITWGDNTNDQRKDVPRGTGFIAITAGCHHSLGLRKDGTVVTWGRSAENERRDAPTSAGFVAIASRSWHSVGLRNDGTLVTWGPNSSGQRNGAPTTTSAGFVAIVCGINHNVALGNVETVH